MTTATTTSNTSAATATAKAVVALMELLSTALAAHAEGYEWGTKLVGGVFASLLQLEEAGVPIPEKVGAMLKGNLGRLDDDTFEVGVKLVARATGGKWDGEFAASMGSWGRGIYTREFIRVNE